MRLAATSIFSGSLKPAMTNWRGFSTGLAMEGLVPHLVRHFLYLARRHRRDEAQEQEEVHAEEADGGAEERDVDEGRRVHRPAARDEVAVQRDDDDVEALEPHADVDEDGRDPHDEERAAQLAEPEDLRDEHVAEHLEPEERRV